MTQRSGIEYFLKGFSLILTPGLRRFVLVPLAINLILFSILFYLLFMQIQNIFDWLEGYLPEMLSGATTFLWPVAVLLILLTFSYVFSAATNWIAAPFNGLLAERMEAHLTGQSPPDGGLNAVLKDIPRTFKREFRKLTYYIPRAIGFLLLFFLPPFGQILWFLFSAWMMAIQYCDYAYDNNKIEFDEMKHDLRSKKGLSFSFGIMVLMFSMIPIVNLVVMPVAICGATLMYVERFKANNRYIANR